MNDLLQEAAYQAWRQWARHTPVRFDPRLHRVETAEEAHRRRWETQVNQLVKEQFEFEARAVLRVGEAYRSGEAA